MVNECTATRTTLPHLPIAMVHDRLLNEGNSKNSLTRARPTQAAETAPAVSRRPIRRQGRA